MSDSLATLRAALAGRYRIERELGAGGMATVYLAHDERHDRNVALKLLKPDLAAVIGAERFLAEIKTTANLQHPHILPLHDSGEVNGTVWYVMPLVEGESLRDRLTRETQLPIDDALQIAREVASALDYAHRHGVIHRDIKPENILLHDGRAVVADFGIALAVSRTDGGTRLTETGMSLGTPHYMSPEQALGERTIDARTDVYALGAVLYEMLTGEPPFTGPTAQAIIAKVMNAPPAPIATLRPTVPAGVDAAVARALAKLPADRFRSAADFANALQSGATTASHAAVGAAATASHAASKTRTSVASLAPWIVAGVAAAAAVFFATRHRASSAERVTAAIVPLEIRTPRDAPRNEVGVPISISPDGSFVVYVGADPENANSTALWMRHLDGLSATVIPGTRGAQSPVVAGDGKTIQFLTRAASRVLNTRWEISVDGGLPQQLPAYPGFRRLRDGSAAAAPDSTIVIIPAGTALPPNNRRPNGAGRRSFSVSPDKRWVTQSTRRTAQRDSIEMRSMESGRRMLIAEGNSPSFLDNDVLAFRALDGRLQVGRLATDRSKFVAPPITVLPAVALAGDLNAIYSVGDDGTLVYVPGGSASQSRPVWIANGHEVAVPGSESRVYGGVSLAPDGRRAAMTVGALIAAGDIWILDLAQGALTPLTTDGVSTRSTWTRDGRMVTYVHSQLGLVAGLDTMLPPRIYRRSPDSGAPPDSLTGPWGRRGVDEIEWSPDMRSLAVRVRHGGAAGNRDIAVWRVGTDSLIAFATEGAQERGPRFAPDGNALLYTSDRSSRDEVWVETFPGGGNRSQISIDGGTEGMWAHDGSRVFYRAPDGWMMAAYVTHGAKVEVTKRERLFDATPYLANQFLQMYDVAPDGRFLMLKLDAETPRTDVVIIRGWVQQVKAQLASHGG